MRGTMDEEVLARVLKKAEDLQELKSTLLEHDKRMANIDQKFSDF